MDRFDRLLVYAPLDHPESAVARVADELAHQNNAEVSLVDVVDPRPGLLRRFSAATDQLDRALLDASHDRLTEIAGLFQHVEPEIAVRQGVDFIEVINQVYESHHDIVLVGSHPRSKESARLDPTLTHLLRKSPVPVWVVDESHQSGDVMVAIGPEFEDEARVLNRTLVALGTSLAVRLGVKCHLVHSWRLVGESLVASPRVQIPREEMEELLAETEAGAQQMIDELVAEVPAAKDAEVHLMHSRPEQALVDLTQKLQPTVVVMGTLARKGISGLIVGNTAERVLSTIDASLLAVKPPWFVSPVPPPVDHPSIALD